LIGAELGAILAKDEEDGAVIGALLDAAFSATLQAAEDAKKTNVPVCVEENWVLYEELPSGVKIFLRKLPKPENRFPVQFSLK
jgi:hypothetical protein